MNDDFEKKHLKLTPDDPRLTAYALGELEGAEALAVAAAVAQDPALQAVVDDVRALSGDLEDALGAEALPEIEPVAVSELRDEDYPFPPKKVVRFPVFWVSSLMAACFALMLVWHNARQSTLTDGEVVRFELDLSVGSEDGGAGAASPAPNPASDDALMPLLEEAVVLPPMVVEITWEQALKAEEDRVMQQMQLGDLQAEALPREAGQMMVANAPVRGSSRPPIALGEVPISVGGTTVSHYTRRLGGAAGRMAPVPQQLMPREGYARVDEQPWQRPLSQPLSTFAVDVDTASYSNVRRFLREGALPPMNAVRIEEMINAFGYAYAAPAADAEAPIAAQLEVAEAPWAPGHKLVRVGLKAKELSRTTRAPSNLVFLIDVSGSMRVDNKLPLAVGAMRMLLDQLREDDRVAIVTYAGSSGVVLPSTPAAQRDRILTALDSLRPGGSTNGASGIEAAYAVAQENFVEGGINRVVLCTDGDFNVGVTGEGELEQLITAKARTGVFLTALGFGMGNLQDATLETLADRGNGQYGYIDSEQEARRLLVEEVEGTLATVAKDVKIQVEFNPQRVAAYRLIGYENRALAADEFANDAVDGGEMGAGQSVTALYEVVPVGGSLPAELAGSEAPALAFQERSVTEVPSADLLVVHVRAKAPEAEASRSWTYTLADRDLPFAAASEDFRFASAVAGFGLVLRDSARRGDVSLADVHRWAAQAMSHDPHGRRAEFLTLVEQAQGLLGE